MKSDEQPTTQPPAVMSAENSCQSQDREEELLRSRREQLRREHWRLRERIILIETELAMESFDEGSHVKRHGPEVIPPRARQKMSPSARRSRETCPFLASYTDRNVQLDKPGAEHVCYAIGHAHWAYGPADVEAQRSVCMRRGVYPRCPRYRHATNIEATRCQTTEDAKKGWWQFWREGS